MFDTPDNSPKSKPLRGWTLRCCDLDERHDLGLIFHWHVGESHDGVYPRA
jgi:hypothetical protein